LGLPLFSGICSISLLSLLGIQRWLFLAFPSQTARFNSPSFCYTLLALGWAYTAAVIIGPFLSGWAGYKPECLGISCGPIWDDPSNLSYTVYLLVMGYVIPMATIITSSIGLVINMKKVVNIFGPVLTPYHPNI
jgi:hypothetical protein